MGKATTRLPTTARLGGWTEYRRSPREFATSSLYCTFREIKRRAQTAQVKFVGDALEILRGAPARDAPAHDHQPVRRGGHPGGGCISFEP